MSLPDIDSYWTGQVNDSLCLVYITSIGGGFIYRTVWYGTEGHGGFYGQTNIMEPQRQVSGQTQLSVLDLDKLL